MPSKANTLTGTPTSVASQAAPPAQRWQGESQPAELHVFNTERDSSPATIIKCRFRPTQLVISKQAQWREDDITPELNVPGAPTFEGGKPATLQLNLFFDTTDTGQDVRVYTDQLLQMVLKPEAEQNSHPPFCQFVWGKFRSFLGYVPDVSVTFTMFLPNGVPVRAETRMTLHQIKEEGLLRQNPTSHSEPRKTHIVVEGERLDWIAYREYGDSARWRHIARANNLIDPKDLRPGQVLKLTALD